MSVVDKYTKDLVHRNCILCGSDNKEVISKAMKPGPQLQTVICRECSLVYSDPMPLEDIYYSFYSYDYERYYGNSTAGRPSWTKFPLVLEKFFKLVDPSELTYLEIGPGRGNVLWHAAKHFRNTLGVEPSVEFAELLKSELGLNAEQGVFEVVMQDRNEHYNVIGMYHVLEHLYDPGVAISKVKDLLTEDGYFIIEVPNILKPFKSLDHYFLRYVHTFNFSPYTLSSLLKKHGFDIIYWDDAGEDWKTPQNITMIARKTRDSKEWQIANIPPDGSAQVVEILKQYRNRFAKCLWLRYRVFALRKQSMNIIKRNLRFLKPAYSFLTRGNA